MMMMKRLIHLLLLSFLLSAGCGEGRTSAAPQPVELASGGKALHQVVVGSEASDRVRAAAATLADYLGRIGKTEFKVVVGDGTGGIAVGLPADFPNLKIKTSFREGIPGREDYLLRTHAKGAYLLGATDLAVEDALWDFLYRLGYRQFFPGSNWEVVPSLPRIRIALDEDEKPSFRTRLIWYGHGTWGYNDKPYQEWCARNRALRAFGLNTSHSYGAIIRARKQEFEAHPEYLALVDGKRGGGKFCISNPGLRKLVADWALEYLQKNPEADCVSLEPSDGDGWCECDKCAAMGSVSDRVVILANEAAEAIASKFPGKYVGMLAYNMHSPPPSVRVHPAVLVKVQNGFIRGGYTVQQLMGGWQAKGASIGVGEYYSVFAWDNCLPGRAKGSNTGYIAKALPEFHKLGARFFMAESGDNWGPNGLGYYLASRILWDVREADRADEIINDFLQRAFGPAEEPMRRFYALIDGGAKPLLSEDLVGRMYRLLDEAMTKAGNDRAVQARLSDLVLYTRYAEIYMNYNSASGDKKGLIEALLRHSYRMRTGMMVHAKALWVSAHGNTVKLPEGITWNSPEGKHPWKDSTPFSREEIAAMLSEGMANNKTIDFKAVNYSSDLVPAAGPLRLPEVARGNFGGSPMGVNTYHTWLEKPGDIRLKISGGHIVHYRKIASNVQTTLLAAGNPMVGERVAYDDSVKPDGEVFDVLLKSPFTGLHSIQVNPPSNRAIADIEGGLPWTVECSLERKYGFTGAWSLYFYVPKGTKTVGGFAGGPGKGDILDGSGKKVFSFKSLDKPGYFNVAVPEGEDGKLWKLQGCSGAVCLMTAPPYLARSGAELLLPREVVEKDTK